MAQQRSYIARIRDILEAYIAGTDAHETIVAIGRVIDELDARPPVEHVEAARRYVHRGSGVAYTVLGVAHYASRQDARTEDWPSDRAPVVVYANPEKPEQLYARELEDFKSRFAESAPDEVVTELTAATPTTETPTVGPPRARAWAEALLWCVGGAGVVIAVATGTSETAASAFTHLPWAGRVAGDCAMAVAVVGAVRALWLRVRA